MRNNAKKYLKQAISRIEKQLDKQNKTALEKGLSFSSKLVLPENFWDKVNLNNPNRVQEVLKHAKIERVSEGKTKSFRIKNVSSSRSIVSTIMKDINDKEKLMKSLKDKTSKKIEKYKEKLLYGDEKNFNISLNKSIDDIVLKTMKELKIKGTKIPESKRKDFNKLLDKNIKDSIKIDAEQLFAGGKTAKNKLIVMTEKITYEGEEQINALLRLVNALERQRKKNEDIVSGKTPALAEDVKKAEEELAKKKSLSRLFILSYVKDKEEYTIPSPEQMTKILKSKRKHYGASTKEQREYRWELAKKGIATSTKNAFSFSPELAKYATNLLINNWDQIDPYLREKFLNNSSSYFFSSDAIGKVSLIPEIMSLLNEDMKKEFHIKGRKGTYTIEQISDMVASGELD